ncbi:hypothetical protein DSCO28_06350 [Desulfosarcina ovata subsp. sediminis]|uniref:Prepilin-type N-terminal cleavage/methylation domain-containing protein n=1 Tax=Desulfosarcina ovata subsp. sediminis TaxID=885957 RepID=A0A5K7ZK91_9BACT|nr:prepilin-type N-terminal cleavage/methylation domain-containing protein [Desulfosarcina ovata]BBO80069.1 hypothetical protein DSCO28_06350 [Desulfosarcina ovata subsp. sediminis]
MHRFRQLRNHAGVSALEVMVVLIIIGIISVLLIGRSRMGEANLYSQTEVIKSHIRYAQARSMDTDIRWGIRCDDSGKQYWLFSGDDPTAKKHKLPGEESDTVDISQYGLTLTPTTLSFDDKGCPYVNIGSALQNDLQLTLTSDGGASTMITITANTGFVP